MLTKWNNLMILIIIFFMAVHVPSRAQDTSDDEEEFSFDKEQFDELASLMSKMTKMYPLGKFHFLGVGRSPTPITSFVQSVYPKAATNVPLSKFKYGAENTFMRESRRDYKPENHKPLSPEMEEKLFKMLDKYFPSEEILEGKKILLIDYVDSGEGLVAARNYFQKYLESRGRKESIVPLALALPSFQPRETPSFLGKEGVPTFNLGKFPSIGGSMGIGQNYDKYGQFGSFDLRKDSVESITENLEYLALVKEMETVFWPSCPLSKEESIHFE